MVIPSIFCVQIVNAEMGNPKLTISSAVTPNEIRRGETGTLTVVVKEISGDDWAKDVSIEPIPPEGCIISPPFEGIGRINKSASSTFPFSIIVPETANIGSYTGTIKMKYYETGALNIGIYGPYNSSNSFPFTIAKGTGTVSISCLLYTSPSPRD